MGNATFKKVGMSDEKMYGPPKILVCGHPPKAQHALIALLKDHGLGQYPIVFVPREDESLRLKELLDREPLAGLGREGGNRPALIVSGFTEKDLHSLLEIFRAGGTKRPLLATLTPTSVAWTVKDLLDELAREAVAMGKMRQKHQTQKNK